MNWYFFFTLLDIGGWIGLTIFFHILFLKRQQKRNGSFLVSIFVALCAGCWSILSDGLPEIGISISSFVYVAVAVVLLAFYQSIKQDLPHHPVKPLIPARRI